MGSDVGITRTVQCRECAYDLRGLDPDGRCPECGTLIAFSLRDDTLACSQPEYVHLLASGLLLLLVTAIASIALSITSNAIPAVSSFEIVLTIIAFYGAWLLTTPDPSGLGEEKYGRWRHNARIVAVIGVVSSVLEEILPRITVLPWQGLILAVLGLGLGLASVFMLLYLERLAERVSDRQKGERLARRSVGLRWLTIVFYVMAGAAGALGSLFVVGGGGMRPALGGLWGGLVAIACLFGVIGLWMGVSWLILLVGFRRALADEAAEATLRWNNRPA